MKIAKEHGETLLMKKLDELVDMISGIKLKIQENELDETKSEYISTNSLIERLRDFEKFNLIKHKKQIYDTLIKTVLSHRKGEEDGQGKI